MLSLQCLSVSLNKYVFCLDDWGVLIWFCWGFFPHFVLISEPVLCQRIALRLQSGFITTLSVYLITSIYEVLVMAALANETSFYS